MSSSAPVDAAGPLAAPTPIMSGRFATALASVPAPLTPLVGREQVVAQALDLLRTSDVRLLTLTGPGGVGKTRLAIRLAEQAAGEFPGGVVFVPLAPVDNPRLLLLTIAQTLGLRESGSIPRIEQLASVLGGRPRLLVLDNFEQIIEAGPVVTELMSACPALKILVTSRAVLHVSGEQELVVLPLALPGASRSRSLDDIARTEAVALFTMRANSVNPDFRLTQENAPSIAEICNRLDGLPLAIELAAARTKVLSPSALAGRLGDRLTVLIGGPRDQPARLQTMRAAIGWSYDLLEADDRQLFRQLAVFPTGFSLDAAEHVAGSSLVLDRVASLVDSSLLQRVGTQADPRFTMLETIRAFALEQLIESGEEAGNAPATCRLVQDVVRWRSAWRG